MLKKDELDSWNNLFPNCKISENDVANPTEPFLTRLLCAYLHKFGYKVELVEMGADMVHEKRFFQIKLVRHIDHILKITHKSFTFTYYDLITPTRKRTSIMLSILLNYLHYYNMYQMDTLAKTNERLQIFLELQDNLEQLKEERQKTEHDVKKIKDGISKLSGLINNLKSEIQQLEERVNKFSADLDMKRAKLKEHEKQLEQLHTLKMELQDQVVTNKESDELKCQIQEQKHSLDSVRQTKMEVELQAKEMKDTMQNLQEMLKQLHIVNEIVDKKDHILKEFQEKSKQLALKTKDLACSEEQKSELKQQIAKNNQELVLIQQNWPVERKELDNKMENVLKSIEESEVALKTVKERVAATEAQQQLCELQLQEEISLGEYMEKHISHLTLELPNTL